MTDAADDDDVVDLAKVRAEKDAWQPPLVSVPGNRSAVQCRHHHTLTLDEKARTLTCSGCKTALDPYAAIAMVAQRGDELARVRRDLSEARKRLANVLAEEKKAKARLKRARRSLPRAERERAAAVGLLTELARMMPTPAWRNASTVRRLEWLQTHMKRRGLAQDEDQAGPRPGRSER